MCGEIIEPKEIEKDVFIWSCPKCSFIGFEYNNDKELDALNNYLKRKN